MPLFEYKAIDENGKRITGTMEASYSQAVTEFLSKQNYMPLKISEKKQNNIDLKFFNFIKKVKKEDIIMFTKQLVTLLKAGVPIISCLEAIAAQTESPLLKETIEGIKNDLEAGNNFSSALSKYPDSFDDLYVNSVKAGEAGGVLDQVLLRIGGLMDYEEKIKAKIKGAIRYPIFVVIAILLGFSLMMILVVPKFVGIFSKANLQLPLPTRILLGMSNILQHYWYLIFGIGIAVGIGIVFYVRTPKGRLLWDKIRLKLPIFGDLFLKTAMSRFAHMFETLNKSGLPILQTMDIVSKTIGNVHIGNELEKVGQSIEKGKGISRPLQESKLFPPLVVRMIAVGEQSGSLDEMLQNVSEHYDSEVNYLVDNLVGLIEPILTITVGAMILLLALGILLPMWDMMQATSSM
ncbi:type II secretion system F family protein [bacterium]|nr:type II secretion system F family protein [bacterium]